MMGRKQFYRLQNNTCDVVIESISENYHKVLFIIREYEFFKQGETFNGSLSLWDGIRGWKRYSTHNEFLKNFT